MKFLISMSIVFACVTQTWAGLIVYSLSDAAENREAAISTTGVHIIKPGDTLWDLAGFYLNDSFRWPRIWNRNTYIEDPHWIYPGNPLEIPGLRTEHAVSIDTIPFEKKTAGYFTEAQQSVAPKSAEETGSSQQISDRFKQEVTRFLSGAFVAQSPFLKPGKPNDPSLGTGTIKKSTTAAAYRTFELFEIAPDEGTSYSPGDTLFTYHTDRTIEHRDSKNTVCWVNGRAVVRESMPSNRYKAQLIDSWDVVKPKDRVGPAEPLDSYSLERIYAAGGDRSGNVLTRVKPRNLPQLYEFCLIDHGTDKGAQPGDIYAIYSHAEGKPDHIGLLVRANNTSSTLVLTSLTDGTLSSGDRVVHLKSSQVARR